MRFTPEQFRAWPNKSITLLGMSGVGKTWLATKLRDADWFHYSGDYRIGTRYLDEPIMDNIKMQAMQVPFLRDLLRGDAIYIHHNISVDNLHPVSSFLGKLGDPEKGGLPLQEFQRRQSLHRQAEIAAMNDVPDFIEKARSIYGYQHFINDAGGSLCELDDDDVIQCLAQHTLILYIRASEKDESELLRRAESAPKPLYFRQTFLESELNSYLSSNDLPYAAMIEPDDFARWIFPRLLNERRPRYEAIADSVGYTVDSHEVAAIQDEQDFLALLEKAIERSS